MSNPNKTLLQRREFLGLLAAASGAVLLPQAASGASRLKSKAKIVIIGAGAAGLTCASLLTKQIEGAQITLIDPRKEHYYQPGFTLVGGGIKPMQYPISTTAEYLPEAVEWLQVGATQLDPEARVVTTTDGRRLPYDYLIVACGMVLDYAAIDGMDTDKIGSNGLASIYHSPEKAWASWQALASFARSGGTGVFTRPATEMKCAGAPLKYTFIADDHLRRQGKRGQAKIIYNSNNQVLFSVPIVSEKVRMLFQDRGIETNYEHVLKSIDLDRRRAVFNTPTGSSEQEYDFIHVIPPMRAPAFIRASELPWQTGPFAADGWLEVDPHTLRHKRYPEIFAVGDIAGVPKGKTAASVKWQAPVAVAHLLASIEGKESSLLYNGYTSCPLITRLGQAMLVEFDYQNNLTPSFPGVIAPLEELWITWVMKTMALKPTYISMLRARA